MPSGRCQPGVGSVLPRVLRDLRCQREAADNQLVGMHRHIGSITRLDR
jgi:hypothetical protein